jgi:hypothetical protein
MLERYDAKMNPDEVIRSVQRKKDCTKTQAMAYLRKEIPAEKEFQKKILQGLKKSHPDAFIRKITLAQYSEGGMPDILCIKKGHYFGFEVKRPILGEATELQKRTMAMIQDAGGTAAVVSYPEEANEVIKKFFNTEE